MKFQAIGQISQPTTTPAPVMGLNAYDPIVGMGDGYALLLRNYYAQPYGCQVRRGYVRHQGGLSGTVETLAAHNNADKKLYAFVDNSTVASLYDVTTPNIETPVALREDLQNARWQHVNFPNVAGVHQVAVNGADPLLWFQPDNTIVDVIAGDGAADTISGIDPAVLIDVYVHQKRLWFVEKDSTYAWYLPVEQITGEATYFDPGTNWVKGGYLDQIITWTVDDGSGSDDLIAFISSEGEVSVYAGYDPSTIDTFELKGVYYAGAPVGRRTACRYGGDVAIITQKGLVMLSELLTSTTINSTENERGRNINQLIADAVEQYGLEFGWQPFVFPNANMLIVNIPVGDDTAGQYVMNDITNAWSEFLGYNAACWELLNQKPFFGGLGAVYRAWEGYTDDAVIADDGTTTPGEQVRAEGQTAFNYFGSLGIQKHMKMARPTIISRGSFSLKMAVNTDFVFDSVPSPIYLSTNAIGRWDEELWDAVVWSGGLLTHKVWSSVEGVGTAFSMRLLTVSDSETYWASNDWLLEAGGIM